MWSPKKHDSRKVFPLSMTSQMYKQGPPLRLQGPLPMAFSTSLKKQMMLRSLASIPKTVQRRTRHPLSIEKPQPMFYSHSTFPQVMPPILLRRKGRGISWKAPKITIGLHQMMLLNTPRIKKTTSRKCGKLLWTTMNFSSKILTTFSLTLLLAPPHLSLNHSRLRVSTPRSLKIITPPPTSRAPVGLHHSLQINPPSTQHTNLPTPSTLLISLRHLT